jgi:hypothetical protein
MDYEGFSADDLEEILDVVGVFPEQKVSTLLRRLREDADDDLGDEAEEEDED